jgi:hypothetical protein
MSNMPPCGACSYTPSTSTLSISISPKFVGTLHSGRLILRFDTGAEVTYPIPNRLGGGDSVVLGGLARPLGARVDAATIAWSLTGDPAGRTTMEQRIAVLQ